jgi:hypothetical protein
MEAKSARWSSLETSVLKAERSSWEAANGQYRNLQSRTVVGIPEIPDCIFGRVVWFKMTKSITCKLGREGLSR